MIKLKRSTEITNEKFEGSQGIYWKSGIKGTATQFASWVRAFIRKQTTVTFDYGDETDLKITNSAAKTSREFVSNEGQYETLNISFGRKDTVPLVVQAKVAPNTNSIINLHYRPNPKTYKMVDKQFIIRDPNSLSVDPVSKKLVSVVFKGPQFSFSGQGRSLTSIPGYNQALSALDAPMLEAARILDNFDSEMYKSRNIRDYDLIPEIVELKEKYRDWDFDVDTSKIASKNVVTYIFNHPYNPDYSFTVEVRDEGGSTYYFKCRVGGEQNGGNLDYLNNQLAPELKRMQNEVRPDTQTFSTVRSRSEIMTDIFRSSNYKELLDTLSDLGLSYKEDTKINLNDPYITVYSDDPGTDLTFKVYPNGEISGKFKGKTLPRTKNQKNDLRIFLSGSDDFVKDIDNAIKDMYGRSSIALAISSSGDSISVQFRDPSPDMVGKDLLALSEDIKVNSLYDNAKDVAKVIIDKVNDYFTTMDEYRDIKEILGKPGVFASMSKQEREDILKRKKSLKKELDSLYMVMNNDSKLDRRVTEKYKQLKKEMSVQGMSEIPLISDPEDRKKFDAFIKKLGRAIEDDSLVKWANLDITQNPDGSEDWDLILKTQHTKKSDNPDGIISWRIEPALPLQFYQKDRDIYGDPTTRVTYKDKVAATDIRTNFGYIPSVQMVELNSPAFFNEITKACAFFLEEYGAYNRQLATKTLLGKAEPNRDQKEILSLMNLNNQITPDQISDKLNLDLNSVIDLLKDLQVNGFLRKVGNTWEVLIPVGKDWIQSYDKPDYDLSNWMDRTLAKIEPELERLQKEYNLSLEDKIEEVVTNTTADLLSQYNILLPQDRPQDSQYRDTSGKLVFTGSYIDKSFVDHLLELRVNFDRGDKFVVWIRPDLKGSGDTKASGQSDLSFFSNWVKQNVSPRTAQRSSDNYRQAIAQELINLGAIEGRIKGTLDITTSKIKEVTIDLKVTNNQVLVNAYRDGKIIDKFALDIKPFTEKPNKVARTILNQLSKHIKESYPSIDRQKPVSDQYWKAVFEHLKKENGIQLQSNFNENYIIVGTKKCRAQFNPIGTVKLTTMTGREIVEEQFNADPRYFLEDYQSMNNLINEKKNLF